MIADSPPNRHVPRIVELNLLHVLVESEQETNLHFANASITVHRPRISVSDWYSLPVDGAAVEVSAIVVAPHERRIDFVQLSRQP